MSAKPRVWTVKCLKETLVPLGAILIGPGIKTDEQVVEHSAYQSAVDELSRVKQEAFEAIDLIEKLEEMLKDLQLNGYAECKCQWEGFKALELIKEFKK